MNKLLKIICIVLASLIVLGAAVYITYSLTADYYRKTLPVSEAARKAEEIQSYLDYYFIEDMDQAAMADAAAEAMVEAAGDEWSYYLSADQYGDYREQMDNAYVGIGVTVTQDPEAGGYRILEVTAASPAYEAGIQVDDVITQVEGTATAEMDMDTLTGLVKGEEGTFVLLTLRRGEDIFDVTVERRRIETVVAEYTLLEDNVGYVLIYNFDERCAQETIGCIESLLAEGAESLIFDVRFNGGGYKDEMVEILDYLLPEGALFTSRDYAGREETDRSDAACLDLPMAVLVNQESYSAAEFFAAAIQEYEAGVVVGSKTTGKGNFQNAFRLSDGSLLNISVGRYYTPSGRSLSETGVTPDIELDLSEEELSALYYGELAYEDDRQLQMAMEALEKN